VLVADKVKCSIGILRIIRLINLFQLIPAFSQYILLDIIRYGSTVFFMKTSIELDGRPKSGVGREYPT
jgi:hypothetical protein